jgi:hypothetical protein
MELFPDPQHRLEVTAGKRRVFIQFLPATSVQSIIVDVATLLGVEPDRLGLVPYVTRTAPAATPLLHLHSDKDASIANLAPAAELLMEAAFEPDSKTRSGSSYAFRMLVLLRKGTSSHDDWALEAEEPFPPTVVDPNKAPELPLTLVEYVKCFTPYRTAS